MRNNQTAKTGLGFTNALALLFIGLKLAKVIDWPWIWVLSPIWISIVIGVFCLVAYVLLNEPHKPRKDTWCRECRFKGCAFSDGFGLKFRCTKSGKYVPANHHCDMGEKRKKTK